MLPLKQDFKNQLLEKWDSLSPDQRFELERVLWNAYDSLYQIKFDRNEQLALDRAQKGQEKLDHEFYKRIRKQTEKEMEGEFYQKTEHQDLAAVREKLEKLSQQN